MASHRGRKRDGQRRHARPKALGRLARVRLAVGARRGARHEGSSKTPFVRSDRGEARHTFAPYQKVLIAWRSERLHALVPMAGAARDASVTRLAHLKREMNQQTPRCRTAREVADSVTVKFAIGAFMVLAAVLAPILALASLWRFAASIFGFLPLTILLAAALAAIEMVGAATFGGCLGALIKDEIRTPFELTVPERRLRSAGAVFFGVITSGVVVYLAVQRAHGPVSLMLWIFIGLVGAGCAAYLGVAHYELRPELEARSAERVLANVARRHDEAQHAAVSTQTRFVAHARQVCEIIDQIHHRAAGAFERAWRGHHRDSGTAVPRVPALPTLTDAELWQILFAPPDSSAILLARLAPEEPDDDGAARVVPAVHMLPPGSTTASTT